LGTAVGAKLEEREKVLSGRRAEGRNDDDEEEESDEEEEEDEEDEEEEAVDGTEGVREKMDENRRLVLPKKELKREGVEATGAGVGGIEVEEVEEGASEEDEEDEEEETSDEEDDDEDKEDSVVVVIMVVVVVVVAEEEELAKMASIEDREVVEEAEDEKATGY
jgi:hypothetical protein